MQNIDSIRRELKPRSHSYSRKTCAASIFLMIIGCSVLPLSSLAQERKPAEETIGFTSIIVELLRDNNRLILARLDALKAHVDKLEERISAIPSENPKLLELEKFVNERVQLLQLRTDDIEKFGARLNTLEPSTDELKKNNRRIINMLEELRDENEGVQFRLERVESDRFSKNTSQAKAVKALLDARQAMAFDLETLREQIKALDRQLGISITRNSERILQNEILNSNRILELETLLQEDRKLLEENRKLWKESR